MANLPPGFILDEPEAPAPLDTAPRKPLASPRHVLPAGFVLDETEAPRPAKPDDRDSFLGKVDSAMRGAADVLSFGLADEAAAAGDALLNPVFGTGNEGGSYSERYNRNLEAQRATDEADAENRFGYRLGGQLAGGLTGAAGLAKDGLSLGARAIEGGASLPRVMGASALEGAYLGGAQGFGSGKGGFMDRMESAGEGASQGALIGGAAPAAIAGVTAAGKAVARPLVSGLRPQPFVDNALETALTRAGMSADEVAADIAAARAAGQGGYTVADSLGNAGQRMLAGAVRSPHGARQEAAEALAARQAGQGRRIATALSEGFDAGETAAQRAASLRQARDTAADIGYDAARKGAGAVDVSPAVAKIDEVLAPGTTGVLSPRSNIANDSVEGALSRVRSMLTDGKSNLSDFNAALRAKQDIDDMIGEAVRAGANNRARLLGQVRDELDGALAGASAPYAGARDAFRQGSQNIEAVDLGKQAAQRGRSEDTIALFNRLSPDEQAAFRSGYADEMIRQVQGGAIGANKARPLMSDATAAEFPAFAAPGRAGGLEQRLAREARMFETSQAALGGSRTADNLADMADAGGVPPSVLMDLARGRWGSAAGTMAGRALDLSAIGQAPVRERVTRALMQTDPNAAREALGAAGVSAAQAQRYRALINALMTGGGASAAGQLAAP